MRFESRPRRVLAIFNFQTTHRTLRYGAGHRYRCRTLLYDFDSARSNAIMYACKSDSFLRPPPNTPYKIQADYGFRFRTSNVNHAQFPATTKWNRFVMPGLADGCQIKNSPRDIACAQRMKTVNRPRVSHSERPGCTSDLIVVPVSLRVKPVRMPTSLIDKTSLSSTSWDCRLFYRWVALDDFMIDKHVLYIAQNV